MKKEMEEDLDEDEDKGEVFMAPCQMDMVISNDHAMAFSFDLPMSMESETNEQLNMKALESESVQMNIEQEEVKQSAPISALITDTKMVEIPSGKPNFALVIKG